MTTAIPEGTLETMSALEWAVEHPFAEDPSAFACGRAARRMLDRLTEARRALSGSPCYMTPGERERQRRNAIRRVPILFDQAVAFVGDAALTPAARAVLSPDVVRNAEHAVRTTLRYVARRSREAAREKAARARRNGGTTHGG